MSRGSIYDTLELPALVAERNGSPCGLLTYRLEGSQCEILTLDVFPRRRGTGTALVEAMACQAREAGCRRLWLIVSNDSLEALRFYQQRNFLLTAVHRNAIEDARKLKPSIPSSGNYGIVVRDELELERLLEA